MHTLLLAIFTFFHRYAHTHSGSALPFVCVCVFSFSASSMEIETIPREAQMCRFMFCVHIEAERLRVKSNEWVLWMCVWLFSKCKYGKWFSSRLFIEYMFHIHDPLYQQQQRRTAAAAQFFVCKCSRLWSILNNNWCILSKYTPWYVSAFDIFVSYFVRAAQRCIYALCHDSPQQCTLMGFFCFIDVLKCACERIDDQNTFTKSHACKHTLMQRG